MATALAFIVSPKRSMEVFEAIFGETMFFCDADDLEGKSAIQKQSNSWPFSLAFQQISATALEGGHGSLAQMRFSFGCLASHDSSGI